MKLSFGLAVHSDFDGAAFTLQSFRLHHAEIASQSEIIVVDNAPDTRQGQRLSHLVSACGGRYIPFREHEGTSGPRDRVFREATGDVVLCVDAHVLLVPGSLAKLLAYFEDNSASRDLVSGPILNDQLDVMATEWADEWRAEMWGTWAKDPRGLDQNGPPIEIPAMGLGAFACRKEAWLGFNPRFRGFGGEEWYIHSKFRRAGAKCLCLPFLRWWHRFSDHEGRPPYPLQTWFKIRNYVIGHQELVLPMDRLKAAFPGCSASQWAAAEAGIEWPVDAPETPPTWCKAPEWHAARTGRPQAVTANKGCCGSNGQAQGTLAELYARAAATPSDINEHVPTLRELATGCEVVVEFGVRHGVSTVALLAGQPKRLISYDLNHSREATVLASVAGETKFEFRVGDSRTVEPIESDLVFIDTTHFADQLYAELSQHAPLCRKRIVLHDTVIFGEQGDNGGPGLLPAVRRYLRENSDWTVARHDRNNHGLMILSREKHDKKELPPLWRQGWNVLNAAWRSQANVLKNFGPLAGTAVQEGRLALCVLCPSRNGEKCAECGCPLDRKTSWPHEFCPLGHWLEEKT